MKRRAVVAFSSMAVALAACSQNSVELKEPPAVSTSTSTPSSPPPPPPPPPSHVGGTIHLTGEQDTAMAITLTRLINPATGVDGPPTDNIGNPKGSYVAAMVTIKNTGKSPLEDDANNDAELLGSNNQVYTPSLSAVTECTNFDYGMYRLEPNESVTGCIAFALPPGVTPKSFQYVPSSGFANDFGEWLIP